MLYIAYAANIRLDTVLPGTALFQIALFSCTVGITRLHSGEFVFLCTALLRLVQHCSADRAGGAQEGDRSFPRTKRRKQRLGFLKHVPLSLGAITGADVVHFKHTDTVVREISALGDTGCRDHANTLIWLCNVGPMCLSSSAPSPQCAGVILALCYPRCPDSLLSWEMASWMCTAVCFILAK